MRRPEEVQVFIRRGDTFLVLHRRPEFDAYWHVVAGALEPGESFADAAVREVREETGLDVSGTLRSLERSFGYPLANESAFVRSRFEPDVAGVTVESFVADAPPAWEPTLNEEHDEYRWCAADEAVRLLHWPEPRQIIAELAR